MRTLLGLERRVARNGSRESKDMQQNNLHVCKYQCEYHYSEFWCNVKLGPEMYFGSFVCDNQCDQSDGTRY